MSSRNRSRRPAGQRSADTPFGEQNQPATEHIELPSNHSMALTIDTKDIDVQSHLAPTRIDLAAGSDGKPIGLGSGPAAGVANKAKGPSKKAVPSMRQYARRKS